MKKIMQMISAAALLAILFGGTATFAADSDFGSAGALSNDAYTLEAMLTYAIEDEYLAKAEYEAIMDAYGSIRPFSNIVNAEETHITLLEPLFTTYNVPLPENTAADQVVLAETLQDTYAIGVEAEINNISMYTAFLEQDLPDDVRDVFTRLMNASENHLAAFENALDRSTSRPNTGEGRNTQGENRPFNRQQN